MRWIKQAAQMWLNRQYRITYRAALTGLTASGRFTEQSKGDLIRSCHEPAIASLEQYRAAAKQFGG